MENYEKFFLKDAKEEISFEQYRNRLEDIFLTTRREQYFDEIFRPLLKMCCPEGVNVIPVFDDRNVGRQTDAEGSNKKRVEAISASYFKNKKKKYAVPDYVFVNSEYTFDNPVKPYLMVETKVPDLIYKNSDWFYKDLKHQIKYNDFQLQAEISACGCVIFTDGITWSFLELNPSQDKDKKIFTEKLESIRLVNNILNDKYCERKDCKHFKISWKNNIETLDEEFFREIGLDISGDIKTPPDDWYKIIEQIKNLIQEIKNEKEK